MADASPAARPLSPHLQVWRWTASMAASITHRGAGLALYGGALLLSIWFFAAALGPEAYAPVGAVVGSWFGRLVLFGFAWALLFHTMNGVRHLYWDAGRGLAPKAANMTAWAIYAASFLLTAIIALAANGAAS